MTSYYNLKLTLTQESFLYFFGGFMTYSITDLSKRFNLPASTIRYYEKIGLLENVEHVNSYRRVYNDSHIDRLNAIECFKKALLPLDEIKRFFSYEKNMKANSGKILEMMKTQEAKTIESMETLQAGLDHLQKKIRFYTLVNEAVKNNTPMPSWDDV
jgi:DNA-binding transcriptional MerR regulator